ESAAVRSMIWCARREIVLATSSDVKSETAAVSEPPGFTDHHLLVRLTGRLVKGIAFEGGPYQSAGVSPAPSDVPADTSSAAAASVSNVETACSAARICSARPAIRSSTALT